MRASEPTVVVPKGLDATKLPSNHTPRINDAHFHEDPVLGLEELSFEELGLEDEEHQLVQQRLFFGFRLLESATIADHQSHLPQGRSRGNIRRLNTA